MQYVKQRIEAAAAAGEEEQLIHSFSHIRCLCSTSAPQTDVCSSEPAAESRERVNTHTASDNS